MTLYVIVRNLANLYPIVVSTELSICKGIGLGLTVTRVKKVRRVQKKINMIVTHRVTSGSISSVQGVGMTGDVEITVPGVSCPNDVCNVKWQLEMSASTLEHL